MRANTPRAQRVRRHLRVRKRVVGTPERPRLAVFRSSAHIYAQLIDDASGRTLCSASDIDPTVRGDRTGKRKSEAAKLVGKAIGERASAVGVKQVVFDRGGYQYHGRVRELAQAAREAGLDF